MENTPEAATAPVTEAQPTNTNPAPETQAPAEAPATNDLGLTAEQAAEFKKFVEANGGYNKAFETFKKRISEPAPAEPKAPEQPAQQSAQQQASVEEQMNILQAPEGYRTVQQQMIKSFYDELAARPEYAPIADKIKNGEMLKIMSEFNIYPTDSKGNINEKQVCKFFDMYAKTVPAAPAATPDAAAAPTVDYIPTNGDKIESFTQASRIIAQSADLKDKGLAEHPQIAAAKEYVKNYLSGGKK